MKNTSNSPLFDQSLPKTVTVAGRQIPIGWDFATALRFMEYVDTSEDEDEVFLETVLKIWYRTVPEDRDGALDAAIRFYCGGRSPKEGYYRPLISPKTKPEDLRSFFLCRYGIDLNEDPLHWWEFRQLLNHFHERTGTA